MPPPLDTETAQSIFEKHPGFPSAMVEVADGISNGRFAEGLENLPPGSPARLDLAVKLLDLRAGAFLKLVDDLEHQKAFIVVLQYIASATWFEFANFHFKDANCQSPDMQACWSRIASRVSYWQIEGFRRLAGMPKPPPPSSRRGYRAEVRKWMADNEIETNEEAASALAVSVDILKSIMSDKGKLRCSEETLSRIFGVVPWAETNS